MAVQLHPTRRVTLAGLERNRHHREIMALLLSRGRLPMIARPRGR